MHRDRIIVIGTLSLIFIITAVLYIFGLGGAYHDLIINAVFLVAPCAAVIAGINATRGFGMSNTHGKSMLLITLGIGSWWIGETLFAVYDVILHINPYPSMADVFYLLAYPLVLWGIVRELVSYRTDISPMKSLIISILSIILSIVVYNIMIIPSYHVGATTLENFIAVGYGVVDLFLIVTILYIVVLTIDFRGGKLFNTWITFLIDGIFILLGDILYALYTTQYNQNILPYKDIDLFWTMSYTLFALSLFEKRFMVNDAQEKVRQLLKKDRTIS